jgi:superfamily II DNA or RNA helicase
MLKLRSYQQEALDAIELSLLSHTRVACVLPTGAGKTVLFAHLIDKAHREGKKALVLVHREELAEQAKAKVHSVAPRLTVGIVKAERNEVDADVIIASVQTLARPERRESVIDAGQIGLVIVDECHHAVARTWMEVLGFFGCFPQEDPQTIDTSGPDEITGRFVHSGYTLATPCVGFTATLTRQDGKGLGDVWETVAYEKDILWMIDNGYLTDVRGQSVTVDDLDMATIARSRGDYVEGQLGEALIASGAAEVTAQAYYEHAAEPPLKPGDEYQIKQGVLFAPTVASAYAFAKAFNEAGIPTETVEGTISSEDRALIYKRYEAGEIRVLANCMVLTEGWDAPWAEVAVIARPTSSASLYTQMVGRVLRPWPGKSEALVLDVVGVAGRHKLQSLTDLVKTTVLDGESYAEARLRIEKELDAFRTSPEKLAGTLAAKQVELFANSHSTWLQTKGGRWFIPTQGGIFFLWPEDDGKFWRLGYMEQYSRKSTRSFGQSRDTGGPFQVERKSGWIEEGMTLEYAMAWGEQLAELDDPTVSLKDRSWRRTKPSEAQIAYALRLKCVTPELAYSMRKGELSDKISIHLASKQLDR